MSSTGKWLLQPVNPDSRSRLFCFPFAGVGASALRSWPNRIGSLEVCRVQLPGRENRMREKPYHDFERFADDAAEALRPALDKPYALFGHCMGALLAYALLVRLEQRGLPLPVRLYASSSLVPHRGFFGPFHPSMTDEYLTEQLRIISRTTGAGEPLPELLPLALRVLRNDVQMCFDYAPPGPRRLPCPVTTIGWQNDADVRPAEMLEWQDYAEVESAVLPGDAFTFLQAPPALLELLERHFAMSSRPSAVTA